MHPGRQLRRHLLIPASSDAQSRRTLPVRGRGDPCGYDIRHNGSLVVPFHRLSQGQLVPILLKPSRSVVR